MAHWSTNLTMHQPRPTTQGVQDHSKLHHQPSPPKLTLPDTPPTTSPTAKSHAASDRPKRSAEAEPSDRQHGGPPTQTRTCPQPPNAHLPFRYHQSAQRDTQDLPLPHRPPTHSPRHALPSGDQHQAGRHTHGCVCRRVRAVYTSPPPLSLIEAAGAGAPAPEDYGVPDAAVARHRAELFEHPAYGGPYTRAAALVHTLEQRLNLTISRSAVPRTPPASSCCPPPLGGRTQPRVDDAHTPPREGVRTAYPTLRDPDHLNHHHPHDQATRPERATPSWARRPAPTNGSPTPSTRSRAARTTIALPRPGRDRCFLRARDCRRLVGQAVWGCRMRAPCGRRPSPLSG